MSDHENPPIESIEDAMAELRDLRGRSIIEGEFAQVLADEFGVDLGDSDIVHPTSDLLPYREDDTPAVAVHDLVRFLVAELGGDATQGSPFIGRGTSADSEYKANFPTLERLVEERDG